MGVACGPSPSFLLLVGLLFGSSVLLSRSRLFSAGLFAGLREVASIDMNARVRWTAVLAFCVCKGVGFSMFKDSSHFRTFECRVGSAEKAMGGVGMIVGASMVKSAHGF